MISPEAFKELNVKYTAPVLEEIRSLGMKSVYYFCGNPQGKLDMLLSMRPDALSFEESKKNFKFVLHDYRFSHAYSGKKKFALQPTTKDAL